MRGKSDTPEEVPFRMQPSTTLGQIRKYLRGTHRPAEPKVQEQIATSERSHSTVVRDSSSQQPDEGTLPYALQGRGLGKSSVSLARDREYLSNSNISEARASIGSCYDTDMRQRSSSTGHSKVPFSIMTNLSLPRQTSESKGQVSNNTLVYSNTELIRPFPLTKQMLRDCVKKCLMNLALRFGYFKKWRKYPIVNRRKKYRNAVLSKISRNAHITLLISSYSLWRRLSNRRSAFIKTNEILFESQKLIGREYLLKLYSFYRYKLVERQTLPILTRITQSTNARITHIAFSKWVSFVKRRLLVKRKVSSLVITNAVRLTISYFRRWMRGRYAIYRTAWLAQKRRHLLRFTARYCLRQWTKLTVRNRAAVALEQENLKMLARRYLVKKWEKVHVKQRKVLMMNTRLAYALLRGRFTVWVTWITRIVIAEKELQKSLAMLLQRYFFKWKRHHTRATLLYHTAN